MRIKLIIFLCFFKAFAQGQTKMVVYLKDKGIDAQEQLLHPEKFLSDAAIERRILCSSNFDLLDVPVSKQYINILESNNCVYINASKWLNAVMVSSSLSNIHALLSLPMVLKIEVWAEYQNQTPNIASTNSILDYGSSASQITMLNLDKLHDSGFTGNNVLVAVFDGGFNSVNTMPSFKYIRDRSRIKATRDFVNEDGDVYADDIHGEEVFSVLASKADGGVIGSGFDANFLLARTENVISETHAEEYNWMRAAEWADSAGARVIQSSLGYSDFDADGSYTPANMDGKTAIITKAALIATRKGIVVVNSAGNEGDKIFRKITAPSDADSILCVGSVNSSKGRVSNSGQGPSADNRIKPDVMAQGGQTAYYNISNNITYGTGTSFAAPLISGMCACLLQKNNFVTNIELINAVKASADRYTIADTFYGYGIPNAFIADTILKRVGAGRGIFTKNKPFESLIKNSLVNNTIELKIIIDNTSIIEVFNSSGALVLTKEINESSFDISILANGNYYLKLNKNYIGKFIKQ